MTKVPMPVCRIQDGQMMRDNRIMRTDRPGGNIRLFLCKMKKKKKEVENMKSKYRFRRILSGVMAAVTILSTVISPLTVYASEEPKAAEPPAYESVKDQLDENEVVKATDLELEVGQDFDVSTDFTNLEIKDESKVKVTFQKAENDAGENFSTSHADTYHAVYYVEPVNQNHPVYQIGRNLIVKEPVTAAQSEPQTEQAVTEEDTGSDDEEAASQEETETVSVETEIVEPETAESETEEPEETEPEFQGGLSESEFDAALEEAETENTTDKESGLTLSDVLEQAGEQDIDLMAMEDGETVSFTAVNTSTRATQDVDVTRGTAYYYADYGLGSYVTYKYTVKFGNVSATAYCVQPSKAGPGDGVYKITKLGDSKALAKVCYYGTKASGENGFFSEKHPDFSAGKQFIIVHLAASYANNSSDAFSGTNATGQALAMELYNYCMSQPEIPEVDMSFSNADVTAYISGNSQRTEEITFKASELQTITMKLPSGVKLHNVTTGKTSSAGASVEICGGTKFYLSAPLTQAVDVKGEWSVTMKGSIIKDYSAYKITTGSETQDLALVFGEGVTDEKYVDFKVSWVKQATLEIVKKDRKSNKAIAGAVYGVYSDKDGKNLITKMPATDANGASSVTITKTQDTVYLKEISVPNGYLLDTKAYDVKLVIGDTVKQTVTDAEQMASLTVYKLGEVLTGAKVTDDGVSFVYTEQKQKSAVYNVYAAADIVSADGTVIYKKDALVKAGLTTGDDGSVTLDNLYLGKYVVKEMQAPQNLVCTGESQEITLSYAGSNVEKVMGSVTFKNDRQKASVSVYKQDKETRKYLPGGTYGLYAGNDIKAADGTVVVKKDTLIEKVVTGTDGKAVYQADLPIANSYYMKEVSAPAGYTRNSEDVYSFTFQYTTDKEATVSFSHTFQNERVNAKIKLVKEDSETGKTAQGDATLEGAVYGLYAREDIVHPDGQTGVLYPAGTQIATLTTDTEGNAEIADLYLGKYYVKELTPPVGYLADPEEHDLECNDEGDLVQTVERTATSLEDVIKQPFQVIKAANNGKTDADLLKGVGFSAYLESSLKKNKDGSYDFASATPVVLTADGQTEMFTDERGYACSIPLAYGTYIVRETTTPHNFKPVDDFKVVISENNPDQPQVWRVLLDEEFEAKLKIVKKDDETKKSVLVPNTEFKVYDLDNKKYVEQVTTYPSTMVHKSYFTDENGYLILPQNLACGNYRIEEVTAPDGYTHSANTVEIKVDSDTAYQEDPVSGDLIIEVEFENHPAKGRLTIHKEGEVVKGFDKDFIHEEASLAGAVFEVYAAEDMDELFGWFLKSDKRYILFLQQDSRGHLTFMAVNREIPKYLDATLWSRGFPAILTSGTLKAGNGFARTRQMTGLEKETGVRECVAESPFCYKENCLLYIPENLKPIKKGSREEAEQLAGQIRDLVCSTYGHTLVLFTSYILMGSVQQLLRDQIPFPMVQVWRNSQEEIARFKKMENAVLFAAGSCWEGVDFPGDMVSSLIIVKLPFSVPDPIHEAQREQYRSLESYIQTIVVPDMQKKLRQGFGRAIRTEQDTCVVSILDHRAAKKGKYRSDVLEALPKCRMAERIEEVEDFIRSRKVERYYS